MEQVNRSRSSPRKFGGYPWIISTSYFLSFYKMSKYKFPPTLRLGSIVCDVDRPISALNDINAHRRNEGMEPRVICFPQRGRGSARAQFFDHIDLVLQNKVRLFENTRHDVEYCDGYTIHGVGASEVEVEFIEFHETTANGKPGQPKCWAIWQDYREGSEDMAFTVLF